MPEKAKGYLLTTVITVLPWIVWLLAQAWNGGGITATEAASIKQAQIDIRALQDTSARDHDMLVEMRSDVKWIKAAIDRKP
jgi:hypothetical protein